jgi:hypothetical protein
MGHVVARMAEALQPRRSRVRFPLVSLEFFIDVMAVGSTKPLKQ